MIFGENLLNALKQGGVTQSQLAKMTGLTDAAISRYIKGEREPRISQAVKIARALGVPLDLLFVEHAEGKRINLWKDTVPTTPKSSQFMCPYCKGIVYYPQPSNVKKTKPRECKYEYCPHCAMQIIREG